MTDRYENIRLALANGPTPGPWSVRYDYVVQAKSFDEGRLVPIAQPYGLRVDGIDLFANARLIAAAPDLLEACMAAVECGMVPVMSAAEGGAAKHARHVAVADMIRAAIAKATGEQP